MNNILTALLVGITAGILEWDIYGGFQFQTSRPIIVGPVIGLILGDFATGLYIGASLEMIYLGVIAVGAAVPPDATSATAITTALCIISGMDKDAAVTLAVPVAVIAQMLQMLIWTLNSGLLHRADHYLDQGEVEKATRVQYGGMLLFFLQGFIPAFFAIWLGADLVGDFVSNMPEWINNWLNMAGGMLPALGFAMLFRLMAKRKLIPFFIIGFTIAAAFGGTLVSTAAIGLALALLYVYQMDGAQVPRRSSARR